MPITASYDFSGTATALITGTANSKIYRVRIFTGVSKILYVKFFNKATAPVLGTDTPFLTMPIGAAFPIDLDLGDTYQFSLGIGIAFSGAFPALDMSRAFGGLTTAGNVFYGI